MVTEDPTTRHPTDAELAAYLGRELQGEALQRVEAHLAQCAVCRQEIADAKEILRSPRGVRWRVVAPVAAAAAVAVLFFPWVLTDGPSTDQPVHRETPAELGPIPAPVSPMGTVGEVDAFVWARVSGADRYRVTLFDAGGTVAWRATTVDSLVALPDSVALLGGPIYLWKVEARVGWDVWESSELIEFRLEGAGRTSSDSGDSG